MYCVQNYRFKFFASYHLLKFGYLVKLQDGSVQCAVLYRTNLYKLSRRRLQPSSTTALTLGTEPFHGQPDEFAFIVEDGDHLHVAAVRLSGGAVHVVFPWHSQTVVSRQGTNNLLFD